MHVNPKHPSKLGIYTVTPFTRIRPVHVVTVVAVHMQYTDDHFRNCGNTGCKACRLRRFGLPLKPQAMTWRLRDALTIVEGAWSSSVQFIVIILIDPFLSPTNVDG